MKERPILFSGAMVRAILAGQKTQTRRVVKPQSLIPEHPFDGPILLKSPYGNIGDRLWVRETWSQIYNQDGCLNEYAMCPCGGCHVEYRADSNNKYPGEWDDDMGDDPDCPKWRPSIFMPRWASRIMLEITGGHIERLQDITDENAIAEGVGYGFQMNAGWPDYQHINKSGACSATQDNAKMSFATLWDSINDKRGYGWGKNPFVWVVSFRRVKP